LSTLLYKATMRQYLPMGKLAQEKHLRCKDNFLCSIHETAIDVAHSQDSCLHLPFREGFNREGNVEARGIIPRAIEQIFGHIQRHASPRMRFLVRASYLQIYNEAVSSFIFWKHQTLPDQYLIHTWHCLQSTDIGLVEARPELSAHSRR
jgi:hypothetical protein